MWGAARTAACLWGVETGVGKERGGLCLSGNKPDTLGDAPRPPGSDVVLSPQPSDAPSPLPPPGCSRVTSADASGMVSGSELSAAGVPPGRSCQQVRGHRTGPARTFLLATSQV